MKEGRARSRTRLRLWLLGLVCLAAVVAAPAVTDRFSAFDDDDFILSNPQIVDPLSQSPADLLLTPGIGYIVPVTSAVEALLFNVGGGSALPFHLCSLILHMLVTGLVFLTAREALQSKARGDRNVRRWSTHAAGLGALLFAVHPLIVEPVAWATGLKDLLMAAFGLSATLLFLRGSRAESTSRARYYFMWASVLAILAMLSKPTGAFLAVAWLAWTLSWRMRHHRKGVPGDHGPTRLKHAVAPALIVLAAGCLLTLLSALMHTELNVDDVDALDRGAWQPLLALGHQLVHFFWPDRLAPRYRVDRAAGFTDFYVLLGLAGGAALLSALVLVRRRPVAFLGVTLAAAAYLPVSSIIPFPRIVADSYLYVPIAGLSIALAPVFCRLLSAGTRTRALAVGTYIALIVLLGARSFQQSTRWRSPVALWYPVAQTEDTIWPYAWRITAESLALNGDADGAVEVWSQFFARVDYPPYLGHYGLALEAAGATDDAECVLLDAIYTNGDPRDVHNLALLLVKHPERESRFPAHSIKALNWAIAARNTGKLSWSRADQEALDVLQRRTSALIRNPEGEWPGQCPALDVPAYDGPPRLD